LAVVICVIPLATHAADPVFDGTAVRATSLEARVLTTSEKDGIVTEEVQFHSHKDGEKRVDIFAILSYPKGGKKLPAFIWNNGGLAKANTFWTTFGAKRGYATLSIDFPMPGYRSTGNYSIVSGLTLTEDPKQAPIYHGAVALLKAVTYLESRAEVDKDRIGMAGSSWGGFYTTLMIGLDDRLKVGSCMFGCGALELGNNWWDGAGQSDKFPEKERKRWSETLDPALRLSKCKTPIAWFTGTNDLFYWLPSVMQSYDRAAGPKHLGILPNFNHALTPELDEQVFAWLDVHLKNEKKFLGVSGLEIKDRVARWTCDSEDGINKVEVLVSPGGLGNWQSRVWLSVPAKRQGKHIEATLPESEQPLLVIGSVTDKRGFRSATTMQTVEGIKKGPLLKYDGCADWGGFETEHLTFVRLHGYTEPGLGNDAHSGKQSALLKTGRYTSPPLLYTPGVPHRLRLWVRADTPTPVALKLNGNFDGKAEAKEGTTTAGDKWAEVTLDFTPPASVKAGSLRLEITVPKGKTLQVDSIRLEPVGDPS